MHLCVSNLISITYMYNNFMLFLVKLDNDNMYYKIKTKEDKFIFYILN